MSFWIPYALLLLLTALFFGCSLYVYLTSRRDHTDMDSMPPADIEPELIALQAQFIVAPHRAIEEARYLLRQRSLTEPQHAPAFGARDASVEFSEILSSLERSH